MQIINGFDWNPEFSESKNYKNWIAILDLKTCPICRTMHGKIWRLEEKPEIEPGFHDWCRCEIKVMKTVKSGTATTKGLDGADWTLKYESKLPEKIRKFQAKTGIAPLRKNQEKSMQIFLKAYP